MIANSIHDILWWLLRIRQWMISFIAFPDCVHNHAVLHFQSQNYCVQFTCNIILNAHRDCAAKLLFCMACCCADYKQSNNIWFECCLFCLTFQQQGERLILCVDATCGYGNWQQHEDLGTVQLLYLSCTKINVYYNDKTCNMITKWYDITAGYETEQNLHRWALRFVPWIF